MASSVIEKVGWALLHSLWQIVLIALVLGVLRMVFRRPGIRHGLAMLALTGSVAWPVATLVQSWPRTMAMAPAAAHTTPLVSDMPEDMKTLAAARAESPATTVRTPVKASPTIPFTWRGLLNNSAPWAAGFWLSGLILLTLRHAGALMLLRRLRSREVSPATEVLQAMFDSLKASQGVRRGVTLLISARALTPMIIGTLRPVVLIPTALATGLNPAELEALLAHELAHLRRWDDVANLLQCVIETLLFFHPAVWWMSRVARQDRELCCDDLAVQRGIEAVTLAQALGRLALWPMDPPQPALAATGHGPVITRIRRLLQPAAAPPKAGAGAWPLVLMLLAGVLPFIPFKSTQAEEKTPPRAAFRGRILDRHGVVLAESDAAGLRHYPQKTLAAHVVGYTGLAKAGDKTLVGRSGIEQSNDKALADHADVTLTIDSDLQRFVEETLEKKSPGGGACVVMNPNTGEVLSLASWPTYDLNLFAPHLSAEEYNRLNKDPAMPLMGRAFQGSYHPTSTFKLVTALAGLESRAIDAKTIFNGDSSFTIDDRVFRNWNKDSEGPLDLTGAIKRSCNTWFYQAALKTGPGPVISMAQDLGFGKPSGLPLNNEAKGFVPTDAFYLERYGHNISPGILASLAIGEVIEASPMQVAVATSAIANGGTVLRPRLTTRQPAGMAANRLGIDRQNMEAVRKGMLAAVNDEGGTAHNAHIDGVQVAGKTGTAQWRPYEDSGNNRWMAWFTCFAPYDHPQVAVTIVYEGKVGERVSGGSIAAPIAKDIIEQVLRHPPEDPLPNATNAVDAGPPAERYNTAWFASATVEDHPVTDKLSGRLYLPLARTIDPRGIVRYDSALLLTAGYAQLFEGNVSVQRGKALRVESGSAPSAAIDSDRSTKVDASAWPSLWTSLWEQKHAPSPPSEKPSASLDEKPKVTKLPASVSPPPGTGGYRPETILMADGTTRGFLRGSSIFPASEVTLDPPPRQATFTPPVLPPGEQANEARFIIQVKADGKIVVEGQTLTPEELTVRLGKLDKDQAVILRADSITPYSSVVQLLDLCQKAGLWNIGLAPPRHEAQEPQSLDLKLKESTPSPDLPRKLRQAESSTPPSTSPLPAPKP